MNPHERITRANDITDKRSLRLKTIAAVAAELMARYGACGAECRDDDQAALWFWIHNEAKAAIEALDELAQLVKAGADDAVGNANREVQ